MHSQRVTYFFFHSLLKLLLLFLYKMPCRVGMLRPEPTSCWFEFLDPLPLPDSSFFLLGVNRFERRRFFRDVVGVELGVGPSLLLGSSLLAPIVDVDADADVNVVDVDEANDFVSHDGIANLASIDPMVPTLLDPIVGGAVGGWTAIGPLLTFTVAKSSNWLGWNMEW